MTHTGSATRQRSAWFGRLVPFADLLGRAALVGYFSILGTLKCLEIWRVIGSHTGLTRDHYLDIAAHVAGLLFISLVLGTTIVRLKPLQSAAGWEPRASSFVGAFLTVSLGAFPVVEASAAWRIASIALIVIGWLLSTLVLARLGRSFSITAQARRLVTTGPYAIVRHPLYLCEEIAIVGAMLLSLSPATVSIVVVQWMFQLRRMTNEEVVLRSAFPEYATYAAQTPKIIPGFRTIWPTTGKASPTRVPVAER